MVYSVFNNLWGYWMHGVKTCDNIISCLCLLSSLILLTFGAGCAKKVIQPMDPVAVAVEYEEFVSSTTSAQTCSVLQDVQGYSRHSFATKYSDRLKNDTPVADLLLSQYQIWKKVPHRTGGLDHRGIDCSGLLMTIFQDAFDYELPRTSREQSRMGYAVSVHQRRPGDLVFFKDRGLDHIGVIVDEDRFLHTSSKRGVTLSKFDSYWKPRLRCVRRVLDQ
jgi:cell wall-associated NlpC family hydrolase